MHLKSPQPTAHSIRLRHRLTSVRNLVVYSLLLTVNLSALSAIYLYTPTARVQAAANNTINFQARLLTNTGALVPDGNYHVEFKLYDSAAAGASAQGVCSGNSSTDDCWWRETRTTGNLVTVKNGYLTASLGSVTAFGANIPWDQELWLTMNIGGNGGSPSWNGEMNPRMKVTAVPYAITAESATKLRVTNGASSTTLSVTNPTAMNTILLPDASGTVAVSASGNIALSAAGNVTLTGQIPIANGGTGASTGQGAINAISQLTTAGDLLFFDGSNTTRFARGTNGDCLKSSTTSILWGTCGAASGTLQSAYDAGTAGDQVIQLSSTNDSIIFRNPASGGSDSTYVLTLDQLSTGARGGLDIQSAGTGNLLRVRDTTATAQDVLTIADGGATTFRNQTNSTTAFRVVNVAGNSLLNVDTSNTTLTLSGPTTITDSTGGSATTLTINNASGTGNLLQVQKGGSNVLLIKNSQQIEINNSALRFTGTNSALNAMLQMNGGTLQSNYTTTQYLFQLDASIDLSTVASGTTGLDLYGLAAIPRITNGIPSGTVESAAAVLARVDNPSNAAINNMYGLLIPNGTPGTNTTNRYGVYVASLSGATNNYPLYLKSSGGGELFSVDNTGQAIHKTSTNSATAFQVQDSSAAALLLANTVTRAAGTAGNMVKIGNSTGTDTATTLLVVDSATAVPTTNLASLNGGLFYNSTNNKLSIIENGTVKVLCNTTDLGCGTGSTLQGAYTAGTTGDQVIQLSGANDSIIIRNPASGGTDSAYALTIDQLATGARGGLDIQSAGTGNLLRVRDTTATAQDVLTVADGGATTFRNQTNSATAFQVQNAGGVSILTVDTSGGNLQVGSNTTDSTANLFVLDSYDQATDPSGTDGGMYYNTNLSRFRCYEGGAWANCVGGGNYVNLAPATVQADPSTNSSIFINKTGSTGHILQLQDSGTDVLTVRQGENGGGNLVMDSNFRTTSNLPKFWLTGRYSSTNTSYNYGFQNSIYFDFNNNVSNVYGLNNIVNLQVAGAGIAVTNAIGALSRVDVTTNFLGSVTEGNSFFADQPNFANDTADRFNTYNGFRVQMPTALKGGFNGNSGNTSGTLDNNGVKISAGTAEAGAGGTLTNDGIDLEMPSGNTSGTTNRGIYITGDGGASAGANYAIYSSSAARSYLSGSLGVGTVPTYKLDVADSQATTYVARVQNTNTGTDADGLLIDLGVANGSRTTSNYFVGFAGSGTVAGKIQGGASAVAYTTSGADYAEYFKANPADLPKPGELVMLNTTESQSVLRAGNTAQAPLAGIVSTNPGFIGNGPVCDVNDHNCDANYATYNALVALSGQVPAKVNTSNGAINIGDPITISSIAGEGAKATTTGYIVGYALEPFASGSGTIKVLVRPQFYTVNTSQTLQGTNLNITGNAALLGNVIIGGDTVMAGNLNTSGNTTLNTLTVNGNAVFNGNLTVQNVTVATITINGHIITAGGAPVITAGAAAGAEDVLNTIAAPSAVIEGNDTAGTITIVAGANTTAGDIAEVTFNAPFAGKPKVIVSAKNGNSAVLQVYNNVALDKFILSTMNAPMAGQTYQFDYFVVQ